MMSAGRISTAFADGGVGAVVQPAVPIATAAPSIVQSSAPAWQPIPVSDTPTLMGLYNAFGGPSFWSSLGYTGQRPTLGQVDSITGDVAPDPYTVQFAKFAADHGYGYNYALDDAGFRHGQLTQNGAAVAGVPEAQWSAPDNTGFEAVKALVTTVMAVAGAYVASGANVSTAAPAVTDGLSGMDLAADAAIGSGNNVTTAASVFTDAGVGAGAWAPSTSTATKAVSAAVPAASGGASSSAGSLLGTISKALPIVGALAGGAAAAANPANTLAAQTAGAQQQAAQRQRSMLLLVAGAAVVFLIARK